MAHPYKDEEVHGQTHETEIESLDAESTRGGEMDWQAVNQSVQSYFGILKHCNSYSCEMLFGAPTDGLCSSGARLNVLNYIVGT